MEWTKGEFTVSTDASRMNIPAISYLLSNTYWAAKRPADIIESSIENSVAFGVYHQSKQIGFARVVTDKSVFSWILDVVIDERYRRNGLGRWLMECILAHPELACTKFGLATSDAHDFYKEFNFKQSQCMRRD